MTRNNIEFSEADLILNKNLSVYHLNLRTQDIAHTIITVGDPGRVKKITKYFDSIDFEMNKREFITQIGTYKGKRLMVMSTGMGPDNIEILLNELDALVNIDLEKRVRKEKHTALKIVRIGTSGGLLEELGTDSHLASATGIGFDNLHHFYNFAQTAEHQEITKQMEVNLGLGFRPYIASASKLLLEKVGFDMFQGNTATCPGFYAPQGRSLRFEAKIPDFIGKLQNFKSGDFRITNFEMETSAYYALGALLGHELLSLNAIIANRATNKFAGDYSKNMDSLIVKTLDRLAEI